LLTNIRFVRAKLLAEMGHDLIAGYARIPERALVDRDIQFLRS
jgi:hypothetical protein